MSTSTTSQSSRASSIQPDIDFPARHLRPEDAYTSPPRHHKPRSRSPLGRRDTVTASSSHQNRISSHAERPRKRRARSSSRRRHLRPPKHPRPWKKLLWIKQSYPDNYTDEATFLDALQRNPRLQPYEFWTLVGDSTVIVQHVCSVVVFVCCFVGIYRGRGDFATLDGADQEDLSPGLSATHDFTSTAPPSRAHSRHPSTTSPTLSPDLSPPTPDYSTWTPPPTHPRLQTLKSATLIYFSLLGLSPLLKSLTLSTSSDSIWALAAWLITLNVFTFDYSSPSPTPAHHSLDLEAPAGSAGEGKTYPASLSTNAALMASTVLASRLPSTAHVFSLTLFSISIFGLFPVFRRSLRTHSPQLHNYLTLLLVLTASASLGLVVGGENSGWGSAVGGMVLGSVCVAGAMGGAGWWLIGLQRFKNEIRGPWDPARPRIGRGAWE
ncbi:glycosylphosphatidylinositol anchor biosynthesis [Oleoguttula sp. CCFEE 5521]